MTIQSPEKVKSVADALVIFADKIEVPNDRDFNELGAYVYPLRSQIPVVLEVYDANGMLVEKRALTRGRDNEIVNLYFGDELQLFQMLEANHKGSFEHGGAERQLQVFHNPDQRYRRNVHDRGWVKTGEMGIRVPSGPEFYRVESATPILALSPYVFEGGTSEMPTVEDYNYTLGQIVDMPSKTGPFNQLGKTTGKWYYNGVVDEDGKGRSAVGCASFSDVLGLYVDADWPLDRGWLRSGVVDVVGTWRKAA